MTARAVRPLIAIVPVRALEGAKSRLGEVLDAEERRDLVIELLDRTVRAATAAAGVDLVIVVSADPAALAVAERAGGQPVLETRPGLNGSLSEARAAAVAEGAAGILVLPTDLPAADPEAISAVVAAAGPPPCVVLVPDRHGRGTNALLLAPPDIIPFAFGGDSRAAHRALAEAAGARLVELDGPLSIDLDTPDDLLLAERRWRSPHPAGSRQGA